MTDWLGRPVDVDVVWGEDGRAVLPRLKAGYYHIWSGRAHATLAVVPHPSERVYDRSSFYGVDSAQSWISAKGKFLCPWNDGDTYRTVSDLIWLCGISHVRDRMSWGQVNPRPGVYEYSYYMYNANLLSERGIALSGMFHDCPRWARGSKALPTDLAATYEFCRNAAASFGDRMDDWEFWNEQELGNRNIVWDYVSAFKAASLGFKAGRPGMTVLHGAVCDRADGFYSCAMYESDVAKYSNVFNLHTYSPPVAYPRMFSTMREFFARYGISDMPVWLTECGTNLEGHSDADGVRKGIKAHSPDQELVLAEFYPKSQIGLQMEGVARNYHFVFGAYNERNGEKDWGMMRIDGTMKPIYAAMSAMTRELSAARLEGELEVGNGLRAYLFSLSDGSQTVAFWSESPVDTSGGTDVKSVPDFASRVTLAVADGEYRVTDLCGMRSMARAENSRLVLASTRFPSYVAGLRGLVADRKPRQAYKPRAYTPAADEDLSVVLRIEVDRDDFDIGCQRTRAVLKADTGRIKMFVWNLGDTAKMGHVEISGGLVDGLPKAPIALGARGAPPVELSCTFFPNDDGKFDQKLVFGGVFDGKRITRLVVPVWLEKKFLSSCERRPLAWNDMSAWRRNDSAQSFRHSWDESEMAVRFDMKWTRPVDRWFYPVYRLSRGKESMAGARMLEFEVKSDQDKVENDFNKQYVMLVYGKGGRSDLCLSYIAPVRTWEKRYVEIPEGCSLEDVEAIRFGANPRGMKCTYWVRNIRMLGRKTSASDKSEAVVDTQFLKR